MPVLNRHLYEKLCSENRTYLEGKIDEYLRNDFTSDIDLNGLDEDPEQIITKLIKQEKDNVEACDEKYQKEKNKAKYITLLLSAAVALLGTGFALAPLFIVSTIVIPVLPVLLFGFAIVGIIKLFLNLKINHFNTHATRAISTLDQLREVDKNASREIISTVNHTIQEIKNATQNTSQLLAKLGMFPTTPIPIPYADPANEVHNEETMSSSPKYS